jgi:hypothetical protein
MSIAASVRFAKVKLETCADCAELAVRTKEAILAWTVPAIYVGPTKAEFEATVSGLEFTERPEPVATPDEAEANEV